MLFAVRQWAPSIGGIATAISLIFLIFQIRSTRRQVFGDMAVRMHDELFFKGENPKIIRAVERALFGLKKGGTIFPNGRPEAPDEKVILFEEEDLDDFLGVFELFDELRHKRCIDEGYIEAMFGHFYVKAWENRVIQDYVIKVRGVLGDKWYYSGFEKLAVKFSKEPLSDKIQKFLKKRYHLKRSK